MTNPAAVLEVSETDRAYIAGLVDSLGSIFVHKTRRTSYVLRLDFHGVSKEVALWLTTKIPGGSISLPGNRVTYVTSRAVSVLVHAFSYLKQASKLAQARLSFKFNEIRPSTGRKWTDTEVEIRAHLADQIAKASKPPKPVKTIKLKSPKVQINRVTGG